MSDSHETLSDLLEPESRFVRNTQSSKSERVQEPESVPIAGGRIARHPQMMLAFKKCAGDIEVLPYSILRRIQTDDPDRGFTLIFADVQITVEGQGLTRLFHAACEQRALEIIESERTTVIASDGDSVVTRIVRTGLP